MPLLNINKKPGDTLSSEELNQIGRAIDENTKFSTGNKLNTNEYNISAIKNTMYADLKAAITALNTYIVGKKNVGTKCTFVNSTTQQAETWMYQGGDFAATKSWEKGGNVVEVNDTGLAPEDNDTEVWVDLLNDPEGIDVITQEEATMIRQDVAQASERTKDREVVLETTGEVKTLGYKVLDPAKTFAEQVTEANTIYEIRDEFDLGTATVNMPANCTLKFEGGRLKNGTLNLNSTIVSNVANNVVFKSIILLGVGATPYIESDWFEFPHGVNQDCQDYLQSIINLGRDGNSEIHFNKDTYYIRGNSNTSSVGIDYEFVNNSGLYVYSNTNVDFGNSTIYNIVDSKKSNGNSIYMYYVKNVEIQNVALYGFIENVGHNDSYHGLVISGGDNILVNNIKAHKFSGDGIVVTRQDSGNFKHLAEASNVTLSNIDSQYNGRQGMSIICGTNILIKDSLFANTGYHIPEESDPGAGIDIEPNDIENIEKIPVSVVIRNCKFIGNKLGISAGVMAIADSSIERKVEVYDSYITNRSLFEAKDTIIRNCIFELPQNKGIWDSIYIRSLFADIRNTSFKCSKFWISRHEFFNTEEVGNHNYNSCSFDFVNPVATEWKHPINIHFKQCNMVRFGLNSTNQVGHFYFDKCNFIGMNSTYKNCQFTDCNFKDYITLLSIDSVFQGCTLTFVKDSERKVTHISGGSGNTLSRFIKCYIAGTDTDNIYGVVDGNLIQFEDCIIKGHLIHTSLNLDSLDFNSKYTYNVFNKNKKAISEDDLIVTSNYPYPRLAFYKSKKLLDSNGNPIDALREGGTSQSPTDLVNDRFQYYNTTLGKFIWKRGAGWIDSEGYPVDQPQSVDIKDVTDIKL